VINILSRFNELQESVGPDTNSFLGSIYSQICHVNNILDRSRLAVNKKRIRDLMFAVFDY